MVHLRRFNSGVFSLQRQMPAQLVSGGEFLGEVVHAHAYYSEKLLLD